MNIPGKVEYWDDERALGNSLIVTLKRGWKWSFDPRTPTHVEGFDRAQDARKALKSVMPCTCAECVKPAISNADNRRRSAPAMDEVRQ